MRKETLQIQPVFPYPKTPSCNSFLATAQSMIDGIIPDTCWIEGEESFFSRFHQHIPILTYSTILQEPEGIIINLLCYAEFSHGVGRYITDLFNRWMIPGRKLNAEGGLSLAFRFVKFPQRRLFFSQKFYFLSSPNDLSIALTTLPRLIEEAKLNLLAVYQARSVFSMKSLISDPKTLIRENLSAFLSISYAGVDQTLYDQMQSLIFKISEEEKIGQIKKNIANLKHYQPKNFESVLFHEMSAYTSHYFRENFATNRDPRLLSRIITLHYLFKKLLLKSIYKNPRERQIRIKLFRIPGPIQIAGLLIGINLFHETERFNRKNLLDAIKNCLPEVAAVSDSFIMDRNEEKARIFYLEIQKLNNEPFSTQEFQILRKMLPSLIKKSIENLVHPIFMPRNEEEVLRTIVHLSKQIKLVRDLPHLTIHYEKQTDRDISFLIVLVHLLKENSLPFREKVRRFGSTMRIIVDEVRFAGSLKRRIPKEAVIFRASLEKSPFVRKDYSLDLKRARQKVSSELRMLLGEFRDFNGGMIHKQDEALENLRNNLGPIAAHHEVLLENFFYSLRPGIMQTVLSSEVLRTLFEMLLKMLEEDLLQKGFSFKTSSDNTYLFLMIGAAAPTFKDELLAAISRLKIASYDLTSTFLIFQESATLGLILRSEDQEKRKLLQQTLLETMIHWKINFCCQVKIS